MRHCWPRCPTKGKSSSCGGRRLAKFSPTHADSEVLDVFIFIAEHRRRQGNAQHCSALFPRTICTSVLSAAKERRKLTKPKRAPMTGAGRKHLRKAKTKQDIVEEKPSTAGSDQDGDLLCMPGIEGGGACGVLPPGTEDDDLLTVFFLTAGS